MINPKNRKVYIPVTALLFVVVLSGSKCKFPFVERFYSITVQNNSSDTIYAQRGLGGRFPFKQYPDTVLPAGKPVLPRVMPDGFTFRFQTRKPQEQVVRELIADTLSVYIFTKEIYKNKPWSEVRSNYMVAKRYDLSLEDLKRLNWKIAYPPTPEMRYMKQFPAYRE